MEPSITICSALGSTGTPGGQTGANPISMDAIDEFQVVIAPYDVRYGGLPAAVLMLLHAAVPTFSKALYTGTEEIRTWLG